MSERKPATIDDLYDMLESIEEHSQNSLFALITILSHLMKHEHQAGENTENLLRKAAKKINETADFITHWDPASEDDEDLMH